MPGLSSMTTDVTLEMCYPAGRGASRTAKEDRNARFKKMHHSVERSGVALRPLWLSPKVKARGPAERDMLMLCTWI